MSAVVNRSFEDEGRARLALSECVTHGLLEPFNVTYEKEGKQVQTVC